MMECVKEKPKSKQKKKTIKENLNEDVLECLKSETTDVPSLASKTVGESNATGIKDDEKPGQSSCDKVENEEERNVSTETSIDCVLETSLNEDACQLLEKEIDRLNSESKQNIEETMTTNVFTQKEKTENDQKDGTENNKMVCSLDNKTVSFNKTVLQTNTLQNEKIEEIEGKTENLTLNEKSKNDFQNVLHQNKQILSTLNDIQNPASAPKQLGNNSLLQETKDYKHSVLNLEKEKDFQRVLQQNKQILNSVKVEVKENSQQSEKLCIRAYSELQLASLYTNSELETVDKFTSEFIEAELKGTMLKRHPLYELLENYLLTRNKITGNMLEIQQLRQEYKESQNSLWSLESALITGRAECLDGNIVTASHSYNKAIFHRSVFQTVSRIMSSVRKMVAEYHTLYSYSAEVLKQQIDIYIQTAINSCVSVTQLPRNAPVVLTVHMPPSSLAPYLNELRLCISILFSFQRRLIKDSIFIEETRKWLMQSVAVLLRFANWQDHMFLLNHVLRCPAGVGSWAANFIQAPLSSQSTDSAFANFEVNHIVSILAVIFKPIAKREQFLEQFSQCDEMSGENLWILVDSEGEDEESSLPALRENDLVQVMNQLPLDNLFRRILNIETRDGKDYYNSAQITEHHILRFFAFGTTLLKIIKEGLQTYNQPRYNQFAKRLCRFMRHIVQYATDQWEQFQKCQHLDDTAMLQRLQVEYDAFFLRATQYLFSSQKLGAWQFLAVVPYHIVSIKTLWKIFYFLHTCDTKEELILNPVDTTDFKGRLWDESLRVEFEDKLSKMTEAESYYLLNTFTNMALARKEEDMAFIQAAVLDLLQVGFISEATRETCSKNARILLTYITSKYPQFLSDILTIVGKNIEQITSLSLYLYEELPLSIWKPTDDDIEQISSWLIYCPATTEKSRLARMIISRLNWDFNSDGSLFLPYDMHCRVALIIAQAVDRDDTYLLWVWKMILKLRLHFSDKGFTNLASVPEIDSLDIVYKGIQEHKPFASLLSLLMTNWGHMVPLICTRGLSQLQILQADQQHVAVIFALYLIVPLFLECQESLVNSEHFQHILVGLLNTDRSYVNMAKSLIAPQYPTLEQFGNMIQTHIVNYKCYGLSSPRCMVRLWMNSLVSVPGWNKDYGVLYLLDCIIKAAFFFVDAIDVVTDTLKDLLQALTPQEQGGMISSIFKWSSLSNTPQGSLLSSSSLPNCTYLAYILISIEHEEREKTTGLWKEILVQLYHQKGKVNVDAAIKKAASIIKVSSFTSSSLCIYRWAQQALDTPIDHPLLPLLWQNFFTLYLARIAAVGLPEAICVGEKFFQGVINFNYLKRIKKCLQDTVDFYKKELDTLTNKEDPKMRRLFYENCYKIFKAYSLWLEEARLQESNLYLPGLPAQYASQYLALILQGGNTPWLEYVNHEEIKSSQERAARAWQQTMYREKANYNGPASNSRSGMESEDPVERILRRLSLYDTPKQPPEIFILNSNIPPVNVEDKEKMFKFLEPYFKDLLQAANNFDLSISKHKALDSSYKELVPQLYRSVLNKVKKQVPCKGTSNNTRCLGPALITLEMQEARINERLEHQIQSNRKEYESIINKYLQEPAQSLCLASVVVQKTIDMLQSQLKRNASSAEMGVELFYHILSLIGEETNAYIPARHFITTCLEKLGKTHIMGVDYETPRLLGKILENSSLHALLSPYFSPENSSTSNLLLMYSVIIKKRDLECNTLFAILCKFDIPNWLTTKNPKISQRTEFIDLVLKALIHLGQDPPKETQILHEIYRKHLLCIFEHQFPEHYGDVLTLTLKASSPGVDSDCIAVSVWMEILNSLGKPIKFKLNGPMRDQLRQYAQQQRILNYQELIDTVSLLTKHFSNERLQYGLYGLYPRYRNYVDVFVLLLGMTGHALIISAMNTHLGVLGDKVCEILWPHLRDMFMPWLSPYWMQNIKENIPVWMQQLTGDRAVLLPWIPVDGPFAQRVTHMFFECVQFIIQILPASSNILGFVWQWYVTNFAHPAVKDHVLNVIHASFLALPWNNFWPSVGELELMIKVADQYLPDCHVFLGYIFIEVNWSNWLNVLVMNSPVQISMRVHQCLLNLLIKVSNEPHVRSNHSEKIRFLLVQAESFHWEIVDPSVLQQVLDWYVMSCNPLVLFSQDALDVDFRVLHLLKTVAHYHEPLKSNVLYSSNLLHKRHIFVRSYIKLLSVLVSRHKILVETKQNNFKAMITTQLNHMETVVKDEQEIVVILREFFGLLIIENLSSIALKCFEQWISNKSSDSFVLRVALQEAASSINNSQIVATLYEACLDSYFTNSVSQSSVISWDVIAKYVRPFAPKQTELEAILVDQGKILALYAISFLKATNCTDPILLLNTLLQWLTNIKITSYTEDKLPLIWAQMLSLCVMHSLVDELNTSIVLQKFSQILIQISAEKGVSGWGKGLLGAIGIGKGEAISLKFKFLCKALSAYLLAQLPDNKGDHQIIRKVAGAPGAVGHPGGNKECVKLLLNLEMGQSQGEIKNSAEMALKQIQDTNNSLHNSRTFLANLVTRLYTKPYLKDIECCKALYS